MGGTLEMEKEFKLNIGEEHDSNIDFDSLDEIEKEYQEIQRREGKVDSTSSGNFSGNASGNVRSICLLDDNILQQISMMLDYLNMKNER